MAWGVILSSVLLLILFTDGSAVRELRLLFQAITKAACHLYLVLFKLRSAVLHLFKILSLVRHSEQFYGTLVSLHFLEFICVLCQTIPDGLGVIISLVESFCCTLLMVVHIIVSILRLVQKAVIRFDVTGEGSNWEKGQRTERELENKQNAQVVENITLYYHNPATAFRLKVH